MSKKITTFQTEICIILQSDDFHYYLNKRTGVEDYLINLGDLEKIRQFAKDEIEYRNMEKLRGGE